MLFQITFQWEQPTQGGVNQRARLTERNSSIPASPLGLTLPTPEQQLTISVLLSPLYGTNMTMPNKMAPMYTVQNMNSTIEVLSTSLDLALQAKIHRVPCVEHVVQAS